MKVACLLEFPNYSFIGFDPIEGTGRVGFVTFEGDVFFQNYRTTFEFDHRLDIQAARGHFKMGEVSCGISDVDFAERVEVAKEHLRAGDVYQIVLSREFRAEVEGDPFDLYLALREKSGAPYLFYFDLGDRVIVGASPEKLISVEGRRVESMPIAGTRPKELAHELLSCPKEAAEHVMLVDLARNDVGRVAKPGSVKVEEFRELREFGNVVHLVSKVTGELEEDRTARDAFNAAFPAGTLTGAPKVRAMELIQEIEGKRGLYGGTVVAIDKKGDLRSCIAIRMAIIEGKEMRVRAGAGIVLDSDPMKEAAETRHKANAILEVADALGSR